MEEKNKEYISIAIDGPAAAGKSTVAKAIAKRLGFTYIDTGAMYRAFTYAVIDAGLDPQCEADAVTLIPNMEIKLTKDGKVFCNGKDVTEVIRTPLVSGQVSYIAAMKPVRLALIEMQRDMALGDNVVMDGRDIGTYVLPNAQVKVYQIASVETRAVRRFEENQIKGIDCTLKEVEEEIRLRDRIDSSREFDPLRPASDSVMVDTSYMNIEESINAILDIINRKTGVRPL